MYTQKKTSDQTRCIFPRFCVILLLVSLSLLSLLISCTSEPSTEQPFDTSEPPAESTSNPPNETEAPSSDAPTAPESEEGDQKTLLYYVTLVEQLQDEILTLKTENFLLSTALKEAEKNTPVAADPAADYTYEEVNGAITILSYTGKSQNLTVPSEINGCPVTKIGDSAFSKSKIVSIVLPDTITEIDWFAFSGCTSLKSVTAGSSVVSVGYGAFDGCPSALTLICPEDSYLSKYGKSFGIAVSSV